MQPLFRHLILARLAALAAAVAGGFSLVTWWLGEWRIAALGPDYVPMAPLTALLFILLGLAFSARLQWPEARLTHHLCATSAGLTIIAAALVLVQSWRPLALPWDQWLIRAPATVGLIPIGQMAPLTAFCFLLTAVALLGQSTRFAQHAVVRRSAYLLAGAGLAVGCIVAAAYATGTPLLYGGTTVPVALLTALGFMALNSGLLLAGQVDKLLREWHSHDTAPHVPAENRRFTRRLILSLLGLGALIALAGLFYLRREQTAAREVVHQSLEAIASLKANQIFTWRHERLGEARFLQRNPQILRDLAAFAAAPGDTGAQQLRSWLEPIKGGDRYAAIFFLDAQARPLLAIPADASARVSPEIFAQALSSREPILADLQRAAGDPAAHLDLLVPVRPAGTDGAAVGVIVLRLDPAQFLYPLIQNWPLPSASAESLLVRREGGEVVYLNDLRHRAGAALMLRSSINSPELPAAMAARGEVGLHQGLDYRGVGVLAVIRPIADSPWILIAKVDLAEAYASIQRDAWQTGLVVVLLMLAVVLAGLTLWRQRHAGFLRRALTAERERKAMAERLGLVMQHANDCIFLMDEAGRILEANDRALATYGYTLDELRALPSGGLRPVSLQPELTRQLDRFASPGGAVFETVHRRKDGAVFPVEVSGRSVHLGSRRQLLGIYRDITERKAHEREIERLNRMYFVISQVNQAIVRAKDRPPLLQEICRVLVEFGRFQIAWIGWHDPAAHRLVPVAVAGDTHGYVTDLRISSAAGEPEGQGPVGRAFRTGGTVAIADFAGDATTQPWHERARRSGIQSCLALPLRQEGTVCAVLAVYAGEKDFFGVRETALLEEAAADASFALDVLAGEARRQQAEAALRASEARFRAVFENSLDGLMMTIPDGHILAANSTACHMFGRTEEEIRRLGRDALLATGDPRLGALLEHRTRTGRAEGELTMVRSDSSRFEAEVASVVYQTAEGLRTSMVIRDITARKQAEMELQKLSRVVEQSPTSIVITNPAGTIEYVNPWFCTLTGYTLDEVRGQNPRLLKSGQTPPATYTDMWQTLAAGRTWRGELINRKKNGELYTELAVVAPVLDPAGKVTHYVAIKDDITERKRMEEAARETLQRFNRELELEVAQRTRALVESEERRELVLQANAIGTFEVDLPTGEGRWNEAQFALLGLKPGEAPSTPATLLRYVHPEDLGPLMVRWEQALHTGEYDTEFRIVRPDGQERWLAARGRWASGDTRTGRFFGINYDITARKHLEAETAALLERERQVSEMKTRFISMTSHEFRTPMTAIMGSVELLANHLDRLNPEKRHQIFERINTSLSRMTTMLDDVLTLNRVDAKRTEVRLAAIHLGPFLQNLVHEIRAGDRDGHPFELQLPPADTPFVTDSTLLHHITSNLLSNAVRYSPAGTPVTIHVERDAWRLHLSVENRGIGIPAADRTRIFEPFERGSNVGLIKGNGLGLNIVKRLTALLGGHVTLRSPEDGPTRFTVALPLLPLPTPNP